MKLISIFAALIAFLTNVASAGQASIEDRLAISDVITSIAAGADRHEWERVRLAFADQVKLDYTSLWGGEAAMVEADAIIAQWSSLLPGFETTHHLVTNHAIKDFSGDFALVEADFQATHKIGDKFWTLLGRYTYEMSKTEGRWKVSAMRMDWTNEFGDRGLVAIAAERAKEN